MHQCINASMNIDNRLRNTILGNLGPADYHALIVSPHGRKPGAPSVLTSIATRQLSDVVICLIENVLKNVSDKEMSAYINRTNGAGKNILFFCKDDDHMQACE